MLLLNVYFNMFINLNYLYMKYIDGYLLLLIRLLFVGLYVFIVELNNYLVISV